MKDRNRYWDCLDQAIDASHGGRVQDALRWFDEALKVDPRGAEAHNGRGEILWDAGRIDEALAAFEQSISVDPKFVPSHLNRIELLIEELGEFPRATQLCDALLEGAAELPRLDYALELEVYYLKAKALYYLDDLQGALFLVRRALKLGGDLPQYRIFQGQVLFESGAFEEAREVLLRAVNMVPDSAHAAYYLGLSLERLGDEEAAARAFEAADAIDPERYPRPVAIDSEVFESTFQAARDNLPRSIREALDELAVVVEDVPSRELLTREHFSPQLLGFFHGLSRVEQESSRTPAMPSELFLFRKNFEKACRNEQELFEQLHLTLREEVGHYLGLDQDALVHLGLL